jgi:hypothetical protein
MHEQLLFTGAAAGVLFWCLGCCGQEWLASSSIIRLHVTGTHMFGMLGTTQAPLAAIALGQCATASGSCCVAMWTGRQQAMPEVAGLRKLGPAASYIWHKLQLPCTVDDVGYTQNSNSGQNECTLECTFVTSDLHMLFTHVTPPGRPWGLADLNMMLCLRGRSQMQNDHTLSACAVVSPSQTRPSISSTVS